MVISPMSLIAFFSCANHRHYYNTIFAAKLNYSIPHARTNYGKFNVRFHGATIWNSLDEELKKSTKYIFKKIYL
jgi:hypothetical protein